MNFYKPRNLDDLFLKLKDSQNYFLAGGTDINVQLKRDFIKQGNIFYINHLAELKGIEERDDKIFIGALTTYHQLLSSGIIKEHFKFLRKALDKFASPLITTMATLGGNIANGSPTNDVTPPLLVLDAELELISKQGSRIIQLSDFFIGYKKFLLKENELIKSIIIKKNAEQDYISFYEKVGARNTLTIAKVSVACMKKVQNGILKEVKIAVGSLNEYPRRLIKMEEYLTGNQNVNITELDEILKQEITPISDLRSDKEYRYQVCLNLIEEFVL